ncbi:hypothetical protein A2U01_0078475, partial [Trifolium medium]|nr:hypothetical protein [Trifolium medium]
GEGGGGLLFGYWGFSMIVSQMENE